MSLRKIVLICVSVITIYAMIGALVMFLELPSFVRALLGATVTATIVSSLLYFHSKKQKRNLEREDV
jgi:Na+/glutamate symporter